MLGPQAHCSQPVQLLSEHVASLWALVEHGWLERAQMWQNASVSSWEVLTILRSLEALTKHMLNMVVAVEQLHITAESGLKEMHAYRSAPECAKEYEG